MVLEGRGVCYAGEGPELEQLCPLVEELHLCGNQLVHWRDVRTLTRQPSFLCLVHVDCICPNLKKISVAL